MPSGNRIRANLVYGLVEDNPLTTGAVTYNSAGLAALPTVSSAHAVVTLDPRRVYGEPEIVVITSHAASATVATILRAQYSTVAREHPQGTEWVHQPIDEDFIEILTASTRPSNPYEGQFIYETDTNKLIGFGGVDWAPRDAGGQLGYAQVVANQAGITTVITDLTGLSVVVTVGTGRRIKITGYVDNWQPSLTSGRVGFYIREGATELTRMLSVGVITGGNAGPGSIVMWSGSPSAGAHTYKLSAVVVDSGTLVMGASALAPAFILVEDIGAA